MAAASPMLREFRERGFVVAPSVFEPAEMVNMAELVERVVAEQEQLLRDADAALLATPGRHGGRPAIHAASRAGGDGAGRPASSWLGFGVGLGFGLGCRGGVES